MTLQAFQALAQALGACVTERVLHHTAQRLAFRARLRGTGQIGGNETVFFTALMVFRPGRSPSKK